MDKVGAICLTIMIKEELLLQCSEFVTEFPDYRSKERLTDEKVKRVSLYIVPFRYGDV